MKEPKITKFVVEKDASKERIAQLMILWCDICNEETKCIRVRAREVGTMTLYDLCLPCIKGLSEVAKELK